MEYVNGERLPPVKYRGEIVIFELHGFVIFNTLFGFVIPYTKIKKAAQLRRAPDAPSASSTETQSDNTARR